MNLRMATGLLAVLLGLCVQAGCSGTSQTGGGMTIWEAVEAENLPAIESYVQGGGDLDAGTFRFGKTPLMHAFELKKKRSYLKLLELGANPNTLCRNSTPPHSSVVHCAAYELDSDWLRAALEKGGDPNAFNQAEGNQLASPLGFAVLGRDDRVENVRLLCEHGADIDAPVDDLGQTALYHAQAGWKFKSVLFLLEKGADPAVVRPGDQGHTFIEFVRNIDETVRDSAPDEILEPDEKTTFAAILDWLRAHGKDPHKAKWNGSQWTWEEERQ